MFKEKIKVIPFRECPVVDSARTPGVYDITLPDDGRYSDAVSGPGFTADSYCFALLEKICILPGDQLNKFIRYQQQLLSDPESWLLSLDELLLSNTHVFNSPLLVLKMEKIVIFINLALHAFEKNPGQAINKFDIAKVKSTLKEIKSVEDQLVYLHDLKAEYLQSPRTNLDPADIPFDRKLNIEIEKIHELQISLGQVKSSRSVKSRLAEKYVDNEEFLQMMKISKRTAQTWRDTGVIPFAQVRSKIYYKLKDVEILLDSNYIRALRR